MKEQRPKGWMLMGLLAALGLSLGCPDPEPSSMGSCSEFNFSDDGVVGGNDPSFVTLVKTGPLEGEPTIVAQSGPIYASFTTDPPSSDGGVPALRIVCTGSGTGVLQVRWGGCSELLTIDCGPDSSLSSEAASLDLVGCSAGTTSAGETWMHCGVFGAWPPASDLYSWFLTIIAKDASDLELANCTDERHDGVAGHYCETGTASEFSVVPLAAGFGVVFESAALLAPTSLTLTTGVLPTAEGSFETESLTAPVAPAPAEPPWR